MIVFFLGVTHYHLCLYWQQNASLKMHSFFTVYSLLLHCHLEK